MPLIATNDALRSAVMLVLRKSVFSRDLEARHVAISGYFLLLQSFSNSIKAAGSESRAEAYQV